ncbi:MAG: hypothetical protein K0Q80_2248 [Microvirga sp.]|nr:hypothetical protein [Microvirga sp.]
MESTALSFPPDTQVVVVAPWQKEPLVLGTIGPFYRWIEDSKLACRFDATSRASNRQTIECQEPGERDKISLSVRYKPESGSLRFEEGHLPGIGHMDKQDIGFLLRGIYDTAGQPGGR